MKALLLAAAMLPAFAAPVFAGSVDASYYSRMADLPVVVPYEPPAQMQLPPFKVFIVVHGSCPPGEIERFVSGSVALGIGPSRSCVSRHYG